MLNKAIAAVSVAGLALVLGGCSSDEEDSGIARLDDPNVTATQEAAAAGTSEEQALAFAQCMRDNGVDFPDPTVDSDGNPSFEGALGRSEEGGFDPRNTSFQDAMAACDDLMEGLQIGMRGGDFDQEGVSEALYSYTQCLREEGLDVGDITLDSMMPRGGGAPSEADTGEAGAGEDAALPSMDPGDRPEPAEGRQGPGANMSDRYAEQLGQDVSDPAWIAANEVCQPVLEEAMTAAGISGVGASA